MKLGDRRLAWILCAALPLSAFAACGEDEAIGSNPTPDSGADAPPDTGGEDKGLFGERVPITRTQALSGLSGAVNAVRDKYGMVHIYARTAEDAFRVQGWMMAQDRNGQLEIARRLAEGRVAEYFGAADAGQIRSDIAMRAVGMHRVAKEIYDGLDPNSELKRVLDSFAEGVSAWNASLRAGEFPLPKDLPGFEPAAFTEWTAVDTLAMGRLQTFELSYDADADIGLTARFDELATTFVAGASDPAVAKRAGLVIDLYRFAPPETATPLVGFPDEPLSADWQGPAKPLYRNVKVKPPVVKARKPLPAGLAESARPFIEAVERVKDFLGGDEFAGSNNWAVAGSQTATGNAMLANDPHLGLTSPMVFWPTHLVVEDSADPSLSFEIAGIAFPGIPGVILGSNRTLSWAATTAGYDVTDVYRETVSSDGQGVMYKGQKVAFEKISETVKIAGSPDYTFDVLVVPHHGPIVPELDANHQVVPPNPATGAFSVRWTGHEPTGEVEAVFTLPRTKTAKAARVAMDPFGTGAQNWMFADSTGEIAWTAPANLPYRDKQAFTWDPATYTGQLPCFVLDGASGNHEWTGQYLEDQYIPHLTNPSKGWIATANTDNVASTVDNDPSNDLLPNGQPFYVGCEFAQGYRLSRIHERIEAALGSMTADEMASIQADHKSPLGTRFSSHLIAALEKAEAEKTTPGTHPDLAAVVASARYTGADVADVIATLKKWETDGFLAASGVNPDTGLLDVPAAEADSAKATALFNAWIVRAIARTLEDEMAVIGEANAGTTFTTRAFFRLLTADPTTLATYDSGTGQSALWDDIATTGVVESRDERLVTAMLDGLDDLTSLFGTDRTTWRWGNLHTIRFDSLISVWLLSIPPIGDDVFPKGFPRHGDQWNVDASNFGIIRRLQDPLSFSYGSGPVQRFVAEMTPDGPKIRNALPGGAVMDPESPNFADEAELWRKNETHDIPFEIDDVVAAVPSGGEHILFTP